MPARSSRHIEPLLPSGNTVTATGIATGNSSSVSSNSILVSGTATALAGAGDIIEIPTIVTAPVAIQGLASADGTPRSPVSGVASGVSSPVGVGIPVPLGSMVGVSGQLTTPVVRVTGLTTQGVAGLSSISSLITSGVASGVSSPVGVGIPVPLGLVIGLSGQVATPLIRVTGLTAQGLAGLTSTPSLISLATILSQASLTGIPRSAVSGLVSGVSGSTQVPIIVSLGSTTGVGAVSGVASLVGGLVSATGTITGLGIATGVPIIVSLGTVSALSQVTGVPLPAVTGLAQGVGLAGVPLLTTLFADSFTRTGANAGVADVGGPWAASAGITTTGSALQYPVTVNNTFEARLDLGPQPAEVDMRWRTQWADNGSSNSTSKGWRYQDGNNFYFTRLSKTATTFVIDFVRRVAGTPTVVATFSLGLGAWADNTWFWHRTLVTNVGSAMRVQSKAWRDGTTEPAWQLDFLETSPLWATGKVNFRATAGAGGGVTFLGDDILGTVPAFGPQLVTPGVLSGLSTSTMVPSLIVAPVSLAGLTSIASTASLTGGISPAVGVASGVASLAGIPMLRVVGSIAGVTGASSIPVLRVVGSIAGVTGAPGIAIPTVSAIITGDTSSTTAPRLLVSGAAAGLSTLASVVGLVGGFVQAVGVVSGLSSILSSPIIRASGLVTVGVGATQSVPSIIVAPVSARGISTATIFTSISVSGATRGVSAASMISSRLMLSGQVASGNAFITSVPTLNTTGLAIGTALAPTVVVVFTPAHPDHGIIILSASFDYAIMLGAGYVPELVRLGSSDVAVLLHAIYDPDETAPSASEEALILGASYE